MRRTLKRNEKKNRGKRVKSEGWYKLCVCVDCGSWGQRAGAASIFCSSFFIFPMLSPGSSLGERQGTRVCHGREVEYERQNFVVERASKNEAMTTTPNKRRDIFDHGLAV